VRYDSLPDLLVVLDLRRSDGRLATIGERDERARAAGLALPPRLFDGTPRTLAGLSALLGRSRFGARHAEGLVVRADDPASPTPRAKLVAPTFRPLSDAEWSSRGLVLNERGATGASGGRRVRAG
jgi:hypothetical protein